MIQGFITYTLNVGDMPAKEAQALTENFLEILGKEAPEGWKVIVQPVRNEFSHIEIHYLIKGKLKKAKKFVSQSIPQLEQISRNYNYLSSN